MLRGLFIILLLGIGLLAALFFVFRAPELPREAMTAKYASAASQFLELESGGRVHIRDEGQKGGPTLVLLHGSNASLHTWEPWVAALGTSLRLISIDLPGHGLTGAVPNTDYSTPAMAAFVRDVTRRIGLERFAIAGSSMGGHVALELTLSHPDAVSHLILVDAAGLQTPEELNPPAALKMMGLPVLGPLLIQISSRDLVADALRMNFGDVSLVTEAMVTRYEELNRMEGTRAATLRRFQNAYAPVAPERLATIGIPVLLLWGEEDALLPVATARRGQPQIPGSTLRVYPGVGHLPQEEIPAESARDVERFLKGPDTN